MRYRSIIAIAFRFGFIFCSSVAGVALVVAGAALIVAACFEG